MTGKVQHRYNKNNKDLQNIQTRMQYDYLDYSN